MNFCFWAIYGFSKRKPIRIITSYCRNDLREIRQISKGNFWCTLFTSLSTIMFKSCSTKGTVNLVKTN